MDPKIIPTPPSVDTSGDAPVLACHKCQTVVTDGGQKVWVCERCGEENHAPTIDEQSAQAVIDAVITPSTPPATPPTSPIAPPPTPINIK